MRKKRSVIENRVIVSTGEENSIIGRTINEQRTLCLSNTRRKFLECGVLCNFTIYGHKEDAVKGIEAARCENETAAICFLDERPKKAKGTSPRLEGDHRERIQRKRRRGKEKKKQVHEGFPLVERNTHRFATIQRFARIAQTGELRNERLLFPNRAIGCGHAIRLAL
mgnify:CR=1 FL=1